MLWSPTATKNNSDLFPAIISYIVKQMSFLLFKFSEKKAG